MSEFREWNLDQKTQTADNIASINYTKLKPCRTEFTAVFGLDPRYILVDQSIEQF